MNVLYLDTNIFIYLSDAQSIYHKDSQAFINYCQREKILVATSAETIQEIIHYSKNTKQLKKGLILAGVVLKMVDELFPVTQTTIRIFLEEVKRYPNIKSRDLVHFSTCLENKIERLVTYDREFTSLKGVKVLNPANFTHNP
ncbi:type II toxin-antitoxin system VapC family toxin [Candidatus Daviesbacteria bacterium]|nr:type II toxin-antitoxin system VapC family toxin [Candidatus Daviesbacteria bacterium]